MGDRDLPNVMLLHFARLKQDMPGEIRRIAGFLDISIDAARWPAIVEHCSFDYMKRHAGKSVPAGGAFWEGGAETFIHKGVNGRWRDVLSADEIGAYEARRAPSWARLAPPGSPGIRRAHQGRASLRGGLSPPPLAHSSSAKAPCSFVKTAGCIVWSLPGSPPSRRAPLI